tara:strand:+ start:4534 stop:5871 length:1338 start_codon:yes stop_codon:yes gene_type:complete
MSKNNSTRKWNKVKHNPLCTLDCKPDLTRKSALPTNNNSENKYRLSGDCEYVCSNVPKLIYNLNKTSFNKQHWYSYLILIVSLIIIAGGLIMKFVGNIENHTYLKNIPKFGIIPFGLILLFSIYLFPLVTGGTRNKLIIIITAILITGIILFYLLNTLNKEQLNINIPWEIMIRSYKLQLALAIITLGLFWIFARPITIPALMIFIIVGLNIITLLTSGTTLITSIVDFSKKYKDYKIQTFEFNKIKTVKIEDKTELILNAIMLSVTILIGIILIINIWKTSGNKYSKILQTITILLLVGSYILSFIEPTNYESINKFILSIVTGNYVLESLINKSTPFLDNNIYKDFVDNLKKIVSGDITQTTKPIKMNSMQLGGGGFVSEIYTVVKYTILAAFMNDVTINTLSPIFTRTLFLVFTNGDEFYKIIKKIIEVILNKLIKIEKMII